ncbi:MULTISPECIES: hypothetical protein [unclassified Streptomyces]|uniref:hypothetical protein n=1 Tax=unclassified Streptomyces TaxID=2593676 RepID=UPI000CD4FFE5|nr:MULTISPECIES: hypothetical protein [unclassified Streptomyces]
MHESPSRASDLRTTALASAVALALALPLAFATAGPSGAPRSSDDTAARSLAASDSAARPGDGTAAPAPDETGRGEERETVEAPERPRAASGAFCGPEITSPEGVEARTCVLTEGPDTWGRVYFRNTTGETLRGELTVLRPDGRTVEVRCEVPASDDPGVCETPREPTVPDGAARAPYSAMAELADRSGAGLLVRAGSTRT